MSVAPRGTSELVSRIHADKERPGRPACWQLVFFFLAIEYHLDTTCSDHVMTGSLAIALDHIWNTVHVHTTRKSLTRNESIYLHGDHMAGAFSPRSSQQLPCPW